jgi:hypothetical protein
MFWDGVLRQMGCLANPVSGETLAKLYVIAKNFARLRARLLLKVPSGPARDALFLNCRSDICSGAGSVASRRRAKARLLHAHGRFGPFSVVDIHRLLPTASDIRLPVRLIILRNVLVRHVQVYGVSFLEWVLRPFFKYRSPSYSICGNRKTPISRGRWPLYDGV